MNTPSARPRRLSPSEKETPILYEIWEALGNRPDVRLWRNNRGKAKRPGSRRPVEFGLCDGAADLIGWVTIDPRARPCPCCGVIVHGESLARFLAVEAKSRTGRQSKAQFNFQLMVERGGGIYILAYNAQDAVERLNARLGLIL